MLDNSLSIETLRRAVLCDSAAMLAIVQQYNPYINRLAQRPHLGQDGMIHLIIDEDLKQELVIELLTKIPRFRLSELERSKETRP